MNETAALADGRISGGPSGAEGITILLCDNLARGFCPASLDGYCIGGTEDGRCHG